MMFVEKRIYNLKPGQVHRFLEYVEKEELDMIGQRVNNIIGYYYSEVGELNQVIGMWKYDTLEERAAGRAAFHQHPNFPALADKMLPLMVSQNSQFLIPAGFFTKRMQAK
jgi:hypothetical protein